MINWKVRLKNKNFWIAFVPAILLLVQAVASVFGFALDMSELEEKILVVVNTLFGILTILGIVTDPTTDGLRDSEQALAYDEPKKEEVS